MDILSIFGIRGRPKEFFLLGDALAAMLSVLKLLREAKSSREMRVYQNYIEVAPLLSYCILGPEDFNVINGIQAMEKAESRLCFAIETGDSLDAELAMLTLFAKITHPDVVKRFKLSVD